MNRNYTEFKFPQIKAHPWSRVFSKRLPPDAVDLVRAFLPWPLIIVNQNSHQRRLAAPGLPHTPPSFPPFHTLTHKPPHGPQHLYQP